ncbi:MAG: uroporphyrinogen-III C-methyltransferase [Proteobacteria bacterium]|nr:uroporphyrinogen-III C-methyltransferase [Pseudomonadota bacterium]
MDYFPIFLKLQHQHCLVVGGGDVATRKVAGLLAAGADVTLVATSVVTQLSRWVMEGRITYMPREFVSTDLYGKRLVIAATSNASLNQQIFQAAEATGVLANVVDDPDACRFITPAIVDRSPLIIAISSGGNAPVLSRLLRQKIETLVPAAYGRLARFAGNLRARVKSRITSLGDRRRFWESVLDGPISEKVFNGQDREANALFDTSLQQVQNRGQSQGEVFLVGAGPGDPELLTLKALRLMQQADVVLYDNLVSKQVLDLVRRDAKRISVAKKKGCHTASQADINSQLIRLAREGNRVCRLKGGDPFVFGRGGEELSALAEAHVPFQVVPGISAANGCAAYAGIPLTHRDYADSVAFITGHRKNNGDLDIPWSSLVNDRQTLVFYMGLSSLPLICAQLQSHGLRHDTPAAAVQQGTSEDQRLVVSRLNNLAAEVNEAQLRSPTLIIIGQVVQLAEKLHWFGDPAITSRQTGDISGGHLPEAIPIIAHAHSFSNNQLAIDA